MSEIDSLNSQYKLDSLGLLPDFCLQEIFSREFNNAATAKIFILLSEGTKQKVIENLNMIRAVRINKIIDKFESGELEIPFSRFEKTCEDLMDRVQELKEEGKIQVPEVSLDESFLSSSRELTDFSDNLPRFNFYQNDLHDLISWWNLAAKNIKSLFGKRSQAENIVLERLDDEFSARIFAHSIDDLKKNEFADKAEEFRVAAFREHEQRLNLIEEFLLQLINKLSNRDFAARLADNFPDDESMQDKLLQNSPLLLIPAVKDELPAEDIAMSLFKLKLIHDDLGFKGIEKLIRSSNNYFFKKGLSISFSNMNSEYAQRIIKERKKSALNEFKIKLKMIIDAVTCIRENSSIYIMLELMSSYTVYDFEE
ncbi:hypothetical protein [Desulfovibrio sp. JC010]|uniref:hypothetical protein n=1 Tax=Desulfovibrio sp. JC010 TaxID=2593641 RepID=UPI0013D8B59E|nr:hypothetical protein [Desulfovibrio sp. JC010]NDV26259.1 hypothetical protein [Desulfovibrio sp. JC010]